MVLSPKQRSGLQSHYLGCLLGLAIGDALGAPVEFLKRSEILSRFGPDGLTDLEPWDDFPAGSYTDDTQMSLATAEGLIHGCLVHGPTVAWNHYRHWLTTQDDPEHRRRPGRTCISALQAGCPGEITMPVNNSKGCGGVMRVAPVGLVAKPDSAFKIGAELAALTHGHPSGYLAAGVLAELIARLVVGQTLRSAAEASRERLFLYEGHEETLESLNQALELSSAKSEPHEAIEQIGQGWVGEEALAISLYAALRFPDDWPRATLAAVNHSGDSDSTGSITGAILGAYLGVDAIPRRWREQVENRHELEQLALDLYRLV